VSANGAKWATATRASAQAFPPASKAMVVSAMGLINFMMVSSVVTWVGF
jgi:hypothetical protein